jgi:hypothetical protein
MIFKVPPPALLFYMKDINAKLAVIMLLQEE